MASKRHVVEEGNTPGKPANKRQSENANTGSRKTLFPGEAKPPAPSCSTHMEWSDKEYACLTQYICLYWDEAHTDKWPLMKNTKFWNSCADFINKVWNSSRTG